MEAAGRFERARALLSERAAGSIEHIEGDLLSHLERTAALLAQWGADETLALAGLCHAAYGTDGFAMSLLTLAEREVLAQAIGSQAEHLVYTYDACDRDHLYSRLGSAPAAEFRDRFTAAVRTMPESELRAFVELTFANELELASRIPAFAARYGDSLRELFVRCRSHASRPAWQFFVDTLGEAPAARPQR